MIAWVVGGTTAMVVMSMALAEEMRTFPGGPTALEASIMPGAQAMRPLRWPAEHLDTLGGYLTYHNIVLFAFFLAIYGALQGARAIRGAEDRNALEVVLSTGWSRGSVIRDRALGFLVTITLITAGLALGVAWSMAAGDAPNPGGSVVTMTATGLCALAAYSLAVLVSQVTSTARLAAGVTSLILTALYVATNVWENIGPLGAIRYVSPFYYASASRALVPGQGLDLGAMAALAAMSVALLTLAALAFRRRDYGSTLWARRSRAPEGAPARTRVQRWMLGSAWRAILLRGRLGLLAWALAAAAFSALMMALEPTVVDAWAMFDFFTPMTGGEPGSAPATLYTSFAAETVAPVIAAYAITQSAGWIADLEQGRVEAMLATPLSWTRLVWERLIALTIGVTVITLAGLVSLAIGAASVGGEVSAAGLARLTVCGVLLGLALGSMCAIVVASLRAGPAVVVLAAYIGAAYLMTMLVPMLHWPEWINRLSVFDAFGHPYLDWPSTGGLTVLLLIAIPGGLIAAAVAEHTPKVP